MTEVRVERRIGHRVRLIEVEIDENGQETKTWELEAWEVWNPFKGRFEYQPLSPFCQGQPRRVGNLTSGVF